MHIVTFALLATTAIAYPGQLLSKRALTAADIDKRTGCPRTLQSGQYEIPHYITQISSSQPDKAFGPQYNAVFTPNDISSILSFDIPASRSDANCTLEFIFPTQSELTTSSYSYSGGGSFFFTGYNPGSCPGPETTYNNQPAPGPFPPFPPIHIEPGNAYTIDVGPCFVGAGTCVAGLTSTNDTNFSYFQDAATTGGCPIGLYTAYSYGLPPGQPPS